MGKHWALVAGWVMIVASPARALGPTATDWRDSIGGACIGLADTKALYPGAVENLMAVAGRSRPDGGLVTASGVWAVGTNGKVIYYNGAFWADHSASVPTTVTLNDVYIYPSNVTVGGQAVAGWIVGDGGTLIRIVQMTATAYAYVCENCPAGNCVSGAGGPLNTCSDLYDIFPADHNDPNTGLFFTGDAGCNNAPDNTCPTPFALGIPTLYYFQAGMSGWQEVNNDSNSGGNLCGLCAGPPATAIPYWHDMPGCSWGGGYDCPTSGAMTGLIAANTGPLASAGGMFDNGGNRRHLGLFGTAWRDYALTSYLDSCATRPRFMTSARIGIYAVVFGDTASCWGHREVDGSGPFPLPYNTFLFNPVTATSPMTAIDTGLSASATMWGSVRRVDFLQAWGFGIGVGSSVKGVGADYAVVQGGGATDAYFALIQATDPNQLFSPQITGTLNIVRYMEEPSCVLGNWQAMNGVHIAAYNEAWAVGDGGRILHWTGPTVQPAALAVALSQSPAGGLTPGAWVEIVLSVTNTGEAGLSGLSVALAAAPAGAMTVICGPVCSTFFCGATPACPTGLPPGGPAFFTWTLSVNGCGTNVVFSATAYGTDLLANAPISSATRMGATPPPVTLSLANQMLSGTVLSTGDVIAYRVVVTNTGAATIDTVTLVDTLPPQVTGATTFEPGGFPPAGVTQGLGGTVYEWVGTGVGLAPGQSFTFTITGIAGPVCATTPSLLNRARVVGAAACSGGAAAVSTATAFIISGLPPAAISVSMSRWPATPATGGPVSFQIALQNTGLATLHDMVLADTLPALLTSVTAWVPAGALFSNAGPIWGVRSTVPVPPGGYFTITLTGTLQPSCQTLSLTNMSFGWAINNECGTTAQAVSPVDAFTVTGPLQASLSLSAQQEISGRYLVDVIMTISNTGTSWARPILPAPAITLTPSTGDTVQVSGPTPTAYWGALAVSPGCSVANPCVTQIVWQYRSAAAQPTQFTAQATAEACPGDLGLNCDSTTYPAPQFSLSCTGCAAQGGATCVVTASAVTQFTDSGDAGEFWLDRNMFRGVEKVTVSFQLKDSGVVQIRIYNGIGQLIRTLFDGYQNRRIQKDLTWDGTNDEGQKVASGAYFIKLEADRFVETRKVVRIK